ncbi:TPA: DUF1642 domain-containing protein [Streptococcus suis]|nr:DUF1642 domain-containing protein [Streptococcus suis]
MNKQEAIERIKNIGTLNIYDKVASQQVDLVIKNEVLDIISKIHEPQKVTVPKFIADWIEYCKRCNLDLQMTLSRLDDDREVGDWAYDENDDLVSEKVDMIARAWLDGYEIEKEKLYTVEIPNPNRVTEPIIYLSRGEEGKIFLNSWVVYVSQNWKNQPHAHLTESEIKQDFEWAWQWAKEVK